MTLKLKNGREVEIKKTKTENGVEYFLDDYVWRKKSEFIIKEVKKVEPTNNNNNGQTKSQEVPNRRRATRLSTND